ncbi:MAG: hypothetical protein WC683_02945 [bacterium]
MKKRPVYRSDMTGLSMACRAAIDAIMSCGDPIIFADVHASLEDVIGLASSMESVWDQREVANRYSAEPGISRQIRGSVEFNGVEQTVVLLPATDGGDEALILVDVDDLMVPLSLAALWRHEWLFPLEVGRIDNVIFTADDGVRWRLRWGFEILARGIEQHFGKTAAERARKDMLPVVLRMKSLEG